MGNNLNSISELKECISNLLIPAREIPLNTRIALLINHLTQESGNIDVKFVSNWNNPQGPYIEMESGMMRGFHINFACFKPQYCDIIFLAQAKSLLITDKQNRYKFELKFQV